MLSAERAKSCRIDRIERKDDRLFLYSEAGIHRLEMKDFRVVRVSYTCRSEFKDREKPGVNNKEICADWKYSEDGNDIIFETDELKIVIDRDNASFSYYDKNGRLLLRERKHESRELEEFQSYRLLPDACVKKQKIKTADGEKEIVTEAARIPDEKLFHSRIHFEWQDDECLYGFGQHEEGYLDLRGKTVFIHQANRKIAIPMLVSSLGWGILFETYSPMIFNDNETGSYVYSEAVDEIDLYFIADDNMDGVVKAYRRLTGKAALLPRWAFGYIQSQERYETAEEMLDTANEYRKRGIGLDCLVLDWMSWPDGQWGQKTFDKGRFPDPKAMTDKLHDMNVRFMISVWPTMSDGCPNSDEFKEKGLFLPGSNAYNAFLEDGRKLYWKQAGEGLFQYGVDAWWCDSSEPFTYEWMHPERQEPAKLYAEYCRSISDNIPVWESNAFALFHARALYEGQRGETSEKRVVNLTRSSYTGQQRYGTVLWSGDTDASWDTLRKQVAAGLDFCASGLPYWTTDIGAFFVKPGNIWYWKGEYPLANEDPAYCELFVRWFEWECFLPVFRGHGTDCRRELWHFDNSAGAFYEALIETVKLRYSLMPYIYSLAGLAWLNDASVIRMLAFDRPDDPEARKCKDQFMLGESLMVCPVIEPMYFEGDKKPEDGKAGIRKVYLPSGTDWYDYYSGDRYNGGQWIDYPVPLDKIPVFVKDGSIIVTMEPQECAYKGYLADMPEKAVYRIYAANDAECLLYDDAGDGYGYENGEYAVTKLTWSGKDRKLISSAVHGAGIDAEKGKTLVFGPSFQ